MPPRVASHKLPVPKHWLLDANVLFSEWGKSLCFTLATHHGAQLLWTEHIANECYRNLIRLGRLHPEDEQSARALAQQRLMAQVIPSDHHVYYPDVGMVDDKDRHVAAAALAVRHASQAPVGLVTWNVRDFPKKQLARLGLQRYTPDELCLETALSNLQNSVNILQQSVSHLEVTLGFQQDWKPTQFVSRANGLPDTAQAWIAFLARNRMHLTARHLERMLAKYPDQVNVFAPK